jgi:hypothetical protein
MEVSSHDAAVIYARACRAWYGKRAVRVVSEQVRNMKRRGDAGGLAMWSTVADRLTELDAVHKRPDAELHGKLY